MSASYQLAVDRRFAKRDDPNAQTADFIRCVAFGKSASFADKYFRQGMRVAIAGRLQTGSYIDRDGRKVYTTDVIIEEQEFAQSRSENASAQSVAPAPDQMATKPDDSFMNVPDEIMEDVPFN